MQHTLNIYQCRGAGRPSAALPTYIGVYVMYFCMHFDYFGYLFDYVDFMFDYSNLFLIISRAGIYALINYLIIYSIYFWLFDESLIYKGCRDQKFQDSGA